MVVEVQDDEEDLLDEDKLLELDDEFVDDEL